MKNQVIDTFWENFNMSRCKTAMLVISVIITFTFCIMEVGQVPNDKIQVAFFVVIGYWTGRTTKSKDKNISFEQYKQSKNE